VLGLSFLVKQKKIPRGGSKNMKRATLAKAIFFGVMMVLVTAPLAIGGNIKIWQDVYYSGVGGEFTVEMLGGEIPGVLDQYVETVTKNVAPPPSNSFQTFCMEYNEHFSSSGEYKYEISSTAMMGGTATGDHISYGTAYLYSQFAAKTLSQYDFYNTSSQRTSDAALLQNAIWYIEGEAGLIAGNKFALAAQTYFTNKSINYLNDAPDGYLNVYVLNVTTLTGGNAQDQLIMKQGGLGFPVPEPASMLLLGIGLLGAAAFRRKFKKN
jgi:hypothetical protein